jgi:isochorismate synthase
MDKGLFLFRDPEDKRIQGVMGELHTPGSKIFPADVKTILIKPFESDTHIYSLVPELHSTEDSDFQAWLDEINLPQATEIHALDEFEFVHYIEGIKEEIENGKVEKIVAARCKAIPTQSGSILAAFHKACNKYLTAFVYLFYHPKFGMWFGASPETFLFVEGEKAETVALAGTLREGTHQWTDKEIQEQSIIGKYIEEVLFNHHCLFDAEALTTTNAGPLKHLLTRYHFQLPHDKVDTLLHDLHPTPAVCGYPKKPANDYIYQHENLHRSLYTGWIGWVEGYNLKTWVNLRCARVYKNLAVLYAGCGINAASDPLKEWDETEAKMDVIGKCLQSPTGDQTVAQ